MEWLKQFARLFGWKNRQYETLTEANVRGLKVRVWATQASLQGALSFDHERLADKISAVAEHQPASKLHEEIMRWPGVACVAIVDANGNGVSAYPDWH